MGLDRVAGKDGGNLAVSGQGDIDHEIVAGLGSDFDQLAVQGVVGERALDGVGVAHVERAVKTLDGGFAGEADRDQLAAPRKAGHQVRLDETESDVEVGFDKALVHVGVGGTAGLAQIRVLVEIAGAVRIDPIARPHLGTEDFLEFRVGRLAVQSGGDQYSDFGPGNAAAFERRGHVGQHLAVGGWAGDIANGDSGGSAAARQFLEIRAADRLANGAVQLGIGVG